MKRRRWTDEAITAYLDGRMTAEERVAFEAALAADGALRERVAAMQQVKRLLAAMPMRKPPRSYRLTPAMVASAPSRPRRSWPAPAAYRLAAAAVMVLFLFAGLLWWQQGMRYRAAAPNAAPTFGEQAAVRGEATPPEESMPMAAASLDESETPPSAESMAEEGKAPPRAPAVSPLGLHPSPTLAATASPSPAPSPSAPPPRAGRSWLLGGAGLLLLLLGGAFLLCRHRCG